MTVFVLWTNYNHVHVNVFTFFILGAEDAILSDLLNGRYLNRIDLRHYFLCIDFDTVHVL